MQPRAGSPLAYHFGPYAANVRTRELRKHGMRIQVRNKSFEILIALLENPGEVVTREDLRRRLWPDDTYVDFDNSLNSTVNRLRDALGDSAAKPRLIETLPRVGYRFMAQVEKRGIIQPTLAVLPFANLNHDPEQDFLADGVADALTTALGSVSTLRVISRQSVLHLRGTQKTVPEIARELKTDSIIEGSVLQAGGRVRITAQLVDAAPERHLWAKSYDCEMGDILTLQGQVARAIAEAVQVTLTPAEMGQLSRPRRANPDAHLAYLKGRHLMGHWSRESFERALGFFRAALERDPTHAAAHAQAADCYALLGHWGHVPFQEAFQKAKEAALRAIALDDALSTAHWALGWATWVCDWDLDRCEVETQRAIQLNPSDEHAHMAYAIYLVTAKADWAGAVRETGLALEVDPLSPYLNATAAWMYMFVDDYDRAVEQARRTLELYPELHQAYLALGLAEMCRTRYAEAIAALERAVAISPDALSMAYLGCAQARSGHLDKASSLVEQLLARSQREAVPPRCFVFLYAAIGEQNPALEWLERAYEARDSGLFWLRVMPLYDPLHPAARFQEMLRRVGIARDCVRERVGQRGD